MVIAGRRTESLLETARRFSGSPAIKTHPVDVADRKSVAALFQWAQRELGRVDILVNSAGVNVRNRSMEDLAPEDWDKLMAINVTGAPTTASAKSCRRCASGSTMALIVNINSTSGVRAETVGRRRLQRF